MINTLTAAAATLVAEFPRNYIHDIKYVPAGLYEG